MYKKLLGFRRKSHDAVQLTVECSGSYLPISSEDSAARCCDLNSCCLATRCDQSPCQLCNAYLILPSCVGAIRALQCSFLPPATAASCHLSRLQHCCSYGSKWLPHKSCCSC